MSVRLWPHTKSNPKNNTKVKHRDTNVLPVCPGPTGSFHRSIVACFDSKWGCDNDVILNCTRNQAHRKTNVQTGSPGSTRLCHRFNQNNRTHQHVSILRQRISVRLSAHQVNPNNSFKVKHKNTDVHAVRPGPTKSFTDAIKMNAHRSSPSLCCRRNKGEIVVSH